jgi:PAS domain S-box-containing protein
MAARFASETQGIEPCYSRGLQRTESTMTRLPGQAPAVAVQRLLTMALDGRSQDVQAACCIEEAMAGTGCALGWVGLLNSHRRLDTIAISGNTWEECAMGADSVNQLQNMPLRGIWATVLVEEAPVLINRPASHPARTGLPLGHVPIDNFLGLPIQLEGRTVGMIALANRPGGFDEAQIPELMALTMALALGLSRLRSQAEAALRGAIIEALPDCVAVCDLGGVVTHANAAFVAFGGHVREADVVGWPLLDVINLNLTRADNAYHELLTPQPQRIEALAIPQGGQGIPVEIVTNPMLDASGTPVAITLIVRDISEQRASEERIWAATEDLSRSNQELEQFAYVAARELHSPLRKILAYGEFLESDCGHQLDRLGREYLGRILGSARRQQQMVDGLLRYARISCSEAAFERVDVARLVRDVVSDLRNLLRERGGSIQMGQSVELRCDEPLVRLLLQQLIENALDFHRPEEAPQVRISCSHEAEWCIIHVQDNGMGFDEQKLHTMFQVFGRLQGQHEHGGTGLGLPVAQRIASQHGGTITARSTPGRGSVFTVTVPHRLAREPYVAEALRTDNFTMSSDEERS